MTLYRIKIPAPGEHPSNEWASYQANPSSFYPAVIAHKHKPRGSKRRIIYDAAMMLYFKSFQVDWLAYRRAKRISAGIWNRAYNEQFINLPWPLPTYVPDTGGGSAQPVTSVGNVVKVLEIRNGWGRIETIPVGETPNITPQSHPHLLHTFRSIRVGDNELGNAIDSRGVIVPLYAQGEGWLPMSILEEVDEIPNMTPDVINQDFINAIYYMLQQKGIPQDQVWGYVEALGLEHLAVPSENRQKVISPN